MLATALGHAHSYQAEVVALYVSFVPVAAIVTLMVGAFIYNWHRNHRHHPHTH